VDSVAKQSPHVWTASRGPIGDSQKTSAKELREFTNHHKFADSREQLKNVPALLRQAQQT